MAMVKVYGGSEIMAQSVQIKLEEAGISTIIKDNIESATLAGFGSFGQTVQIFVNEEDVAKATGIIGA
ncbi:DUF2007 domain-containing protein [Flavobacterium salilacus subsp. salilacus]|uniref:putative signal transducing protein n=1 Tax=Flavobacterium TaxID=237 RepID=UPI001075281A|nr:MULTISPECIES: DUF2007 domain-containing protein [Flavobacterium]KAF2519456.1 DUF2007 domain-containing protein [Flavobacterium salilacus subsp. salilacus]MBE1614648.1 DUF2007 domain-containing protein [Flavobacterium sp. SaA2.13]